MADRDIIPNQKRGGDLEYPGFYDKGGSNAFLGRGVKDYTNRGEFTIEDVPGAYVEIFPKSQFYLSVLFTILTLVTVPFLFYAIIDFHSQIGVTGQSEEKKKFTENLYGGSIGLLVIFTLILLIFVYLYIRSYSKISYTQDNTTITEVFKKLSRKLVQKEADQYSDEKVDQHIYDMSTLSDRLNYSANNGVFYNDAQEWAKTSDTGARQYKELAQDQKGLSATRYQNAETNFLKEQQDLDETNKLKAAKDSVTQDYQSRIETAEQARTDAEAESQRLKAEQAQQAQQAAAIASATGRCTKTGNTTRPDPSSK